MTETAEKPKGPATSPLSLSRRQGIALMKQCGWSHHRDPKKTKQHIFRRPDGDGMIDVITVNTSNLSLQWAIKRCGDPVLLDMVRRAEQTWLRTYCPLVLKMADEEPDA